MVLSIVSLICYIITMTTGWNFQSQNSSNLVTAGMTFATIPVFVAIVYIVAGIRHATDKSNTNTAACAIGVSVLAGAFEVLGGVLLFAGLPGSAGIGLGATAGIFSIIGGSSCCCSGYICHMYIVMPCVKHNSAREYMES